VSVVAMGEGAWRIDLPDGCDPVAVLESLRALPEVVDVVVSDTHALVCAARCPEGLAARVATAVRTPREVRVWTLPVRYDGEDLGDVCAALGCSRDALIAAHTAEAWEVLRMGFLPGFAYLGPLPPSLIVPRRSAPRAKVPAGSVALAGARTGVYPVASPGGWNLVGHTTDLPRFDPVRGHPWRVGDRVRFAPA
jgi:UPF0271 protein